MNRDYQPKSGEEKQQRVPLFEIPTLGLKTLIFRIATVYVVTAGLFSIWIWGFNYLNYMAYQPWIGVFVLVTMGAGIGFITTATRGILLHLQMRLSTPLARVMEFLLDAALVSAYLIEVAFFLSVYLTI